MKNSQTTWPSQFARWLFGGPFRALPPPFGNPVPPELRLFRFEAAEVRRHGLGEAAVGMPAHHEKTRPARQDSALERQ